MNKFYEVIGLDGLNKDDLRDDIIHYTTFDENGVHERYIIRLNLIEAFTMKMRLLKFNLKALWICVPNLQRNIIFKLHQKML